VPEVVSRIAQREGQIVVPIGLQVREQVLRRSFPEVPVIANIPPEELPEVFVDVVKRMIKKQEGGGYEQ
jgi:hypothetical protein